MGERVQPGPHTCHAIGCSAGCPPRHLMCRRPWAMVPPAIRREVNRTFNPHQCRQGPKVRPTREWMRAARSAITAVRDIEADRG